jgi:hypothetical protein
MPYARNKIIINGPRSAGMAGAVKKEFKAARKLAKEAQKGGWGKDTKPFRDEMKSACARHLAADFEYLQFLQDWNNRLADFNDQKLDAQP